MLHAETLKGDFRCMENTQRKRLFLFVLVVCLGCLDMKVIVQPVQLIDKQVKGRVSVARVEVVVHQPVANHQVAGGGS